MSSLRSERNYLLGCRVLFVSVCHVVVTTRGFELQVKARGTKLVLEAIALGKIAHTIERRWKEKVKIFKARRDMCHGRLT